MSDEATLRVDANIPPIGMHTAALPCIQVLSGSAVGLTLLILPQVVFGRQADCDAVLEDQGVSRCHARIFLRGKDVWLEDLGSTNGTRLRDKPVEQAILADGDVIAVGPVLVRFSYLSRAEMDMAEKNYRPAQSVISSPSRPVEPADLARWLEQETSMAGRQARNFTLVLAEVEDFVNILHACGQSRVELLLRQLAQVLRSACQPEDVIEQSGPHGFAILLRGLTLTNALFTVERMRRTVKERTFPVNEAIELQLTLRLGVAAWDKSLSLTAANLIERATAELQAAQHKSY